MGPTCRTDSLGASVYYLDRNLPLPFPTLGVLVTPLEILFLDKIEAFALSSHCLQRQLDLDLNFLFFKMYQNLFL